MKPTYVFCGYAVSIVAGAIILWLLIDKFLRPHFEVTKKVPPALSVALGVVERLLYTTAFLMKAPAFVAVWLAFKVAAKWKEQEAWERSNYIVFLIGSGLSIAIAFLGAWICVGAKLSLLLPK